MITRDNIIAVLASADGITFDIHNPDTVRSIYSKQADALYELFANSQGRCRHAAIELDPVPELRPCRRCEGSGGNQRGQDICWSVLVRTG